MARFFALLPFFVLVERLSFVSAVFASSRILGRLWFWSVLGLLGIRLADALLRTGAGAGLGAEDQLMPFGLPVRSVVQRIWCSLPKQWTT